MHVISPKESFDNCIARWRKRKEQGKAKRDPHNQSGFHVEQYGVKALEIVFLLVLHDCCCSLLLPVDICRCCSPRMCSSGRRRLSVISQVEGGFLLSEGAAEQDPTHLSCRKVQLLCQQILQ